MNGGDVLARGAKSATFPSSSHISQDKWDMAFKDYKVPSDVKVVYRTKDENLIKPPLHCGETVEVEKNGE